ncbi:hypothetical protein GOARA_061_01370 [Gordonia araii NBRC 100433]|uniref:DoxX family protein n=1 Tax=Gordonia araii NBRC 100433 TaxID=1073574 RepID=G7H4C2_9ACTN|nr:DoxX family protein [Gordonia araii]NNG96245.1 DoxX family protein [Gordonia araii NBRC 100433]GAB10697.1 hypothetical protein GOARA_061_01370 [Gordonia araii NBRC 100433]
MGSHHRDESDDAERDDRHRVEQSRIPAPPSGFARVDSLDDFDTFPRASRSGDDPPADTSAVTEPIAAEATGSETGATGPASDTEAATPSNIKPAKTERRSHRWNRRPSISDETKVSLDDSEAESETVSISDMINQPPLPETVPTEAVHSDLGNAYDDTEALAVVPAAALPEAYTEEHAGTGEPYEEHGEALRSRRITELEDEVETLRKTSRRGTTDLGLLVLRLAVGAYLAVDGFRKVFGWLGGPSLNGFEADLLNTANPEIGFARQSAGIIAVAWSVTEIVVGIVLIAGFLTPLIAAAGLAVAALDLAFGVTVAGGVHLFADERGSVAFQAALVAMLVVIILCGPGRYSLDGTRGWARRPGIGSVSMVLVGIAAAVLVWWLFNGTNPLNSPGNPG